MLVFLVLGRRPKSPALKVIARNEADNNLLSIFLLYNTIQSIYVNVNALDKFAPYIRARGSYIKLMTEKT